MLTRSTLSIESDILDSQICIKNMTWASDALIMWVGSAGYCSNDYSAGYCSMCNHTNIIFCF